MISTFITKCEWCQQTQIYAAAKPRRFCKDHTHVMAKIAKEKLKGGINGSTTTSKRIHVPIREEG